MTIAKIKRNFSEFFIKTLLHLFLGAFLASVSCYAQTYRISGEVVDEQGLALEATSVLILSVSDSSFLDYQLTNQLGQYIFHREISGPVLFKISRIGYQAIYKTIDISKEVEIVSFTLRSQTPELQQIVVKDRLPVKLQGDTLTYRSESFRDSTENKVGQLLSKLPGVEVELNGTVKVRGHPIRTLLIDGDDLLEDNYQVLTNNLSARIVEDVEIYFNYFDNPLLSTIFDSKAVAINLKTSKGNRRKVNTDIAIGLGTMNRYDLEFNVIGIYDRLKSVTFLNAANISAPLQSVRQHLMTQTDFIPLGLLVSEDDRLYNFSMNTLKKDYSKIGATSLATTAISYKIGKDWKIRLDGILPQEQFISNSITEYKYTIDTGDIVRVIQKEGQSLLPQINLKVLKDIGVSTRLVFMNTFQYNEQENSTSFGMEESATLRPTFVGGSMRLEITHKFNEKVLGLIDLGYKAGEERLNIHLFDASENIFTSLEKRGRDRLNQTQDSKFSASFANIKMFRKFGNTRLIFTGGWGFRENQLSIYGGESGNYNSNQNEGSGQIQFMGNLLKSLEWQISGTGGRIWSNTPPINKNRVIDYVSLSGKVKKSWNAIRNISLNYDRTASTVPVLFAAPQFRYVDRYQITKGAPNLLGLINTRDQLEANFSTGKVLPYRSFFISLIISQETNPFTPSYLLRNNTSFTSFNIETRSAKKLQAGADYEHLIAGISSTVKTKYNYTSAIYQIFDGNKALDLRSDIVFLMGSIRTGFDIPLNIEVGIEQSHNKISSVGSSVETFSLARTTLPYIDLFFKGFGKLNFRWSNNWQIFRANSIELESFLADAELNIRFGKRLLQVSFVGHNIFNSKAIGGARNYEYGQITQKSYILNRFVMAKMQLTF